METTLATLDYAKLGPQPALDCARLESMPAPVVTRVLRGWSPGFARKLTALAKAGTNVIHGHGLWMFPNYYARRVARAHRIPLVVSPRGMLDEWALRDGRTRKAIAWRLYERENLASVRLFHATSASEAEGIRAARFTQPIAVIPNGVDVPDVMGLPGRELLEKVHPTLVNREWILFMSRLHAVKGLVELARAWRTIAPEFPKWQLVVAGQDIEGYGAQMRRRAAELGFANRITFTGMLSGEEKACALANAGALVLPTHTESFGIVVAEALAHGIPVITTTAAPWRELRDLRCGWWIVDREDALQSALVEAMSLTRAKRREMGARGRALVEERYSWPRVAKEMEAAYEWVLGNGQRPYFVREA